MVERETIIKAGFWNSKKIKGYVNFLRKGYLTEILKIPDDKVEIKEKIPKGSFSYIDREGRDVTLVEV